MLVAEGTQFQTLPMKPPPHHNLLLMGLSLSKGKRSQRRRHPYHALEEEVKEVSICPSETNQIENKSGIMEEDSYDVFMGALSLMNLSLPNSHAPDWHLDCPQNPQSVHSPLTIRKLQRRKRIRCKKVQEAIDLEFDDGYAETIKKMYSCKTCSRKFSSFQALGGHRASCYNKLKSMHDDEDHIQIQIQQKGFHTIEEEDNITDEDPPRHYRYYSFSSNKHYFGIHGEADIKKDKVHKCPVCYKVFSCGQALGGHKRCHNSSPPATLEANAATSSVSTIIDQIQIRSVLDLDLNMPAPLDDHDNCIPIESSFKPEITTNLGSLHGGFTSLPKEDEAHSKVGFN